MNIDSLKKTILCLALMCMAVEALPQRRKATSRKAAVPVMEQVRQALHDYDFDRADNLLTKELAALKKKKQATAEIESLLHTAWQGRSKLHATERIAVIDSVVCDKEAALQAIKLSRDNGRVDSYASTYHTADTLGATIYENELANKRYLAVTDKENGGRLMLAVSDKIGEQWSEPKMLSGLNDDVCQNFPFLMSDGLTLYYAAQGPESLGGYDIFVSRADGEDGSFLAPENVGFPFNSTANDYLLVIDEFNQLGWFVTDRRQAEGKVCVYTFIPKPTREVYGDDVTEDELRAIARLDDFKSTWAADDQENILAAQQRLADLRSGKGPSKVAQTDFTFVIDDKRTYTKLDDFRSTEARKKMQQWVELNKNVQTDATMLERLRDSFADASQAQRQQLRPAILKLENNRESMSRKLHQLAKEIRNSEISQK